LRALSKTFRRLAVLVLERLVPIGIALVQSNQKFRDLAVDALRNAGLQNAIESTTSSNETFSKKPLKIDRITSIDQNIFEQIWSNIHVGFLDTKTESRMNSLDEFQTLLNIPGQNIHIIDTRDTVPNLISDAAERFGSVFISDCDDRTTVKAKREALNIAISRGLKFAFFESQEIHEGKDSNSSALFLSAEAVQMLAPKIAQKKVYSIEALLVEMKANHLKPEHYSLDVQKFRDFEKQKPAILIVQPIHGGGLALASEWLQRRLASEFRVFTLRANLRDFKLYELIGESSELILSLEIETRLTPFEHSSASYDSYLRYVLLSFQIQHIHVEHLAWQSFAGFRNAKIFGISVTASIHDFYLACPSYTLLDQELKPCFGVCTESIGNCSSSLWPAFELQELKRNRIFEWRAQVKEMLAIYDLVFSPSRFALDQVKRIYPSQIKNSKILEHNLSSIPSTQLANSRAVKTSLKVLVLGDVSVNKGALKIKQISQLAGPQKIEFHFVGKPWLGLAGVGVHHGPYKDELQMRRLVGKISPDLAIMPGAVPETFSLVLSEVWNMGIPVLGVDHGAIGERIQSVGGGICLPHNETAEHWTKVLLEEFSDSNRLREFKENIYRWQRYNDETMNSESLANTYILEISKLIRNNS